MINFFSYNEKDNAFSLSGIKFDFAPLFLKKHTLRIKELLTIRNGCEFSLLNEQEERYFDHKKGDKTTISWIMEKHEDDPIFMAIIEFLNGGKLSFSIDTLYVKYPKEMDLKKDLIQVLKVIGYFAAGDIINFAKKNEGQHNIESLFGMNSEEITDYKGYNGNIFDKIKQETIELEERYKDIK